MKNSTKSTQSNSLDSYTSRIYDFYTSNMRMPSYSEICAICKIKSKNTAHALVRKLKASGLISVDAKGKLIPHSSYNTRRGNSYNNTLSGSSKSRKNASRQASSITLLGLVEAGFPTPSEESLHDQLSLDDWIIDKREASFMLKVKGDSMKDAGIMDGDMVIVERTTTPKIGQIVVAEVDGSYTLKYLRKGTKGFYLEPANKAYKPIYPTQGLQVSAVVKAVVRKYA